MHMAPETPQNKMDFHPNGMQKRSKNESIDQPAERFCPQSALPMCRLKVLRFSMYSSIYDVFLLYAHESPHDLDPSEIDPFFAAERALCKP